jgi:ATP-dependent DNA helicase PIF1
MAFAPSQKPYSQTGKVKSSAPPRPAPTTILAAPKVSLSAEQKAVLDRIKQGKSIFFSGSAGTGKSVLLREIISELRDRDTNALGITASTGIAAINIGGCTLHSWAGIGIGNETAKQISGKILGQPNKSVLERWRRVKTLIIDESTFVFSVPVSAQSNAVSMVDGQLFDKLVQSSIYSCFPSNLPSRRRWHASFVETTPPSVAYR